ncbi:MAG: DME family drug/metabolite transporter [Gammaproteobacteria bacterium]|jgi:DME family drug/metabolite transporter
MPASPPKPIDAAGADPAARFHWHRGATMIVGAGVFWSTGGLLMRLVEQATPWQILFYRSLALTLFFIAILAVTGKLASLRRGGWALVLAALGVTGAFVGFVFSITHTTVANTFFLLATQPMLTALLAWFFLHERPDAKTWWAMVIALVGVSAMVLDGLASGTLFGNAMGLVSAIGFAVLTVTLRANRLVDMRPGIALGGVFTSVLAATVLLIGQHSSAPVLQTFSVSSFDGLLCFLSGSVQIGCGMALYTLGTRWVSASHAALFALSEVLLAPVWVWFVFAERPSLYTFVGGAILLLAIVIRSWPSSASR